MTWFSSDKIGCDPAAPEEYLRHCLSGVKERSSRKSQLLPIKDFFQSNGTMCGQAILTTQSRMSSPMPFDIAAHPYVACRGLFSGLSQDTSTTKEQSHEKT
jgi:hypothetical protein